MTYTISSYKYLEHQTVPDKHACFIDVIYYRSTQNPVSTKYNRKKRGKG